MKTVSFVIPVYNEQKRIGKTIQALKKGFSVRGIKLEEIIFVDDGSTDKTVAKIRAAKPMLAKANRASVRIISYSINSGKGYAVRVGLLVNESDYALVFDADMSTPLTEFVKLMPSIRKNIPVIVGTRKNGHSTVIKHQPLLRELMGKGFTFISQLILNTWVTDFTCGFKAFSKAARVQISNTSLINRWAYDAELMFLAKKYGYAIQEVPVRWSDNRGSKVNLIRDTVTTLTDLVVIRMKEIAGAYDLSPKTVVGKEFFVLKNPLQ